MGNMTPIKLSIWAYDKILHDVVERHGRKALLMGYKKRVLGWTPRITERWGTTPLVYVDFWDETAKSLFLLEYSEFLTH